jgi:hypothetical protein
MVERGTLRGAGKIGVRVGKVLNKLGLLQIKWVHLRGESSESRME